MRLFHALPLMAAVALAACSNEADEALTDEDLAAGDVAPVIEDNGVMPEPGMYSTSVELVEFSAPGLTEAAIAEARAEFEAGAAEEYAYCVTEETTREQWLSDMTEADCTLSRFIADGSTLDGVMTCTSEMGLDGRVEISGQMVGQGSNIRMGYSLPTAAGEGSLTMQVLTERTGDCS